MRKSALFAIVILSMLVIAGLPALSLLGTINDSKESAKEGPTPQTRVDEKKWTVMVYMAADNSLEPQAISDLNEMEKIGSTSDLNIIVQVDRASSFDSSNGDWTTTRRYYITYDPNTDQNDNEIRSTMLSDLGELDMANRATFQDFLTWAFTDYPAQHYLLVMWDHGEGLARGTTRLGFCSDTGGTLKIWDVRTALEEVKKAGTFTGKIDVIGFDICYGGFFEYAYELKEHVDYYVGSFDEVPDPGWDYQLPLSDLKAYPDIDPKQYAINIADYYVSIYSTGVYASYLPKYLTVSVIDIQAYINGLLTFISGLSQELVKNFYYYQSQITAIRANTEDVGGQSGNPSRKYADLYHFCELITKDTTLPLSMRSAAQAVVGNYSHGVLLAKHLICEGTYHPNNHGPGIYFPARGSMTVANSPYWNYQFSNTLWGDFLRIYQSPMAVSYRPIKDTEDPTMSPNITVRVQSSVDIQGVYIQTNRSATEYTGIPQGNKTYKVTLAPAPMNTTVGYYIRVKDTSFINYHYPPGSKWDQAAYGLRYRVGADQTAPVIYHIPSLFVQAKGQDIPVYARVTDNLGVSEVWMYYRELATGAQGQFTKVGMDNVGPTDTAYQAIFGTSEPWEDVYLGYLPEGHMGSVYEYYFEAKDSSANGNPTRGPGSGTFQLSISGSNGPIMFDRYHGSMSGYSEMYQLAVDKGYHIENLTTAIGMDTLLGVRVLIVAQPTKALTDTEQAPLKSFLSGGGDLFVISGSYLDLAKADSFMDFADLALAAFNSTSHTLQNPLPNELLEGVSSLSMGPSTVKVEMGAGAQEVLQNNNGALVMANSTWGFGKVLASSDAVLDDTRMGTPGNERMAKNIYYWLTQNIPPQAVITGPYMVGTNTSFTLDGSLSSDQDSQIINYTWDMGDGSAPHYSKSIVHSYGKKGVFMVRLIVRDSDGAVGLAQLSMVANAKPSALFEYAPKHPYSNQPVTFTSVSMDTDGFIVGQQWDFGDGTVSLNASQSHVYRLSGTYTVSIWVLDDLGQNASYEMELTVGAVISNISLRMSTSKGVFYDNVSVIEEEVISFVLLDYESKSDMIDNITWDFGDGGAGYGKAADHAYTKQGTFTVLLLIVNFDQGTGNAMMEVTVTNPAPAPGIKVLHRDGNTYTFSAGSGIDTPNEKLIYIWDFDDGGMSNTTGSVVTHTFDYDGKFNVQVFVRDDEGAEGSNNMRIEVKETDNTPILWIGLFGFMIVTMGLFALFLTLSIRSEKKPTLGVWVRADPLTKIYKLAALITFAAAITVFYFGLHHFVLWSTMVHYFFVPAVALLALVIAAVILLRQGGAGRTYVTKLPHNKSQKRIDTAIRTLRLKYSKSKDGSQYSIDRPLMEIRLVDVRGDDGKPAGTLIMLKGKDRPLLDALEGAVHKKFKGA